MSGSTKSLDRLPIVISVLALVVALLTWWSTSQAAQTSKRSAELALLSGRLQSCSSLYDHASRFNQPNNTVNRANAMHSLAQCYAAPDITRCVEAFNDEFRASEAPGAEKLLVC